MKPGGQDASRSDSKPRSGAVTRPHWQVCCLVVLLGVLVLWVGTLGAGASPAAAAEGVSPSAVEDTTDSRNVSRAASSHSQDRTCNRCHDVLEPDPSERELQNEVANQPDHAFEFDHGSNMWCLDCHAREDRNRLRLANGSVVDWTTQMQIQQCGSCHGPVYNDWQAGIHGSWNGSWKHPEAADTCTDCHNPHNPDSMSLEPEPAPEKPPEGPEVARAVLPGGYYAAVGFLGAIAAGLIGYASLALRRDHDG